MSTNATDDTTEQANADNQAQRYAELTIGDDEFVIYDRENHQAWIQSTVALDIDEYR
jgi:hypothetical protein